MYENDLVFCFRPQGTRGGGGRGEGGDGRGEGGGGRGEGEMVGGGGRW